MLLSFNVHAFSFRPAQTMQSVLCLNCFYMNRNLKFHNFSIFLVVFLHAVNFRCTVLRVICHGMTREYLPFWCKIRLFALLMQLDWVMSRNFSESAGGRLHDAHQITLNWEISLNWFVANDFFPIGICHMTRQRAIILNSIRFHHCDSLSFIIPRPAH